MSTRKKLVYVAAAAKVSAASSSLSASCESELFALSIQASEDFFTPGGSASKDDSSVEAASIYAPGLNNLSTLDFTLSGISTQGKAQIYLAYSTSPGSASDWEASCQGQVVLNPDTLEIVYGAALDTRNVLVGDVSMGTVLPEFLSYTLSIRTDDLLTDALLDSDRVYFQALLIQGESFDIGNAIVTPVHEIIIERAPESGGKDEEPEDEFDGK